jgi:hypothetical protein
VDTFEDWLKYQQLDTMLEQIPPDVLAGMRSRFDDAKAKLDAFRPQVFKPGTTGGYCYAVAIEDGPGLRLTLWIRRNLKGECFVMYPRDPESDPHSSYHANGSYHHKSYGAKTNLRQRQPLDQFTGAEHLGMFAGHGTDMAPICDPTQFTSVLTVLAGILEPLHGCVLVDLVEPGVLPHAHHRENPGLRIVCEATYRVVEPWVAIAVAAQVVQG